MRSLGAIPGLLLAVVSLAVAGGAAAQDVALPRLSFATIDWASAIATLKNLDAPQPMAMTASLRARGAERRLYPTLSRLNAVMSQRFTGVRTSPVPVLLPFDVDTLLRDQATGAASGPNLGYLSGFHSAQFFYPGPAGYDAAFVVRAKEVPELADISFPDLIQVQISGSALLYELNAPIAVEGQPVPALEDEFPGIRRMILEHHVRYTFVRFGAPYVVSITCFDASVSRYKMPTCRAADQVAQRFLRALRVVGGMPRSLRAAAPLLLERPAEISKSFGYFGPGQLASGSGFRGQGGRVDYTAYSQIRFPLAEAPARASSEVYSRRGRGSDAEEPLVTWRDNFCERRGFPVGQCPSGIGHQGQDMRPVPCKPLPGADQCTTHNDIVAVRDGVILRLPQQEAAYLFVNSANEHIRFRYLHMNPRRMDSDELLSGRRVHEGEVIGKVGNFSMGENGTSYHLHFDIQVPTKYGWVFVNPYMTLVTAYERLIGERGIELSDRSTVATADPGSTGTVGASIQLEPDKPKRAHRMRHAHHKSKAHRRQRQAQN